MYLDAECIPVPVFSSPDGPADWFEPLPGERMRVRIGSDASGGRLTLLENVVRPGASAPSHFHHDADELFIVLEGHFCVSSGAYEFAAGPGAAVFVPRGATHAFVNQGRADARLLSVFVPGGMEAMFQEAAVTQPGQIVAMAGRHRTVLLGSPRPD